MGNVIVMKESFSEEVNGFVVVPDGADYMVFHPVYDGAFCVYTADSLDEAREWCHGENLDEWTKRLL